MPIIEGLEAWKFQAGAVSYSYREMDLAMMRLFGGFGPATLMTATTHKSVSTTCDVCHDTGKSFPARICLARGSRE